MKYGYPSACNNCSVYKNMVLENNIDCSVPLEKRKTCPCPTCLVFSMCSTACMKFLRKREPVLSIGRL
jgi:hypothetical protein